MKVIKGILRAFDYVEEAFLVLLLALMSVLNFANIVSRYVLHSSIAFTEELTVMAFVWVSFIGAATAYKRGAHLGMSFVVDHFPKKGQAIFVVFSVACSVVMLAILLKSGITMVQGQIMLNSKTPALGLPSALQGLSIPVGAGFMIVRSIEAGAKEFVKLWKEGGAAA